MVSVYTVAIAYVLCFQRAIVSHLAPIGVYRLQTVLDIRPLKTRSSTVNTIIISC